MFGPTLAGWAATLGVIGALIAFDIWHSHRHPRAIGIREAARWSVFYVAVAALFGFTFALLAGWDLGAQYFAGYIVEKSLSVDNLFVFVLIMSTFAVAPERQSKLLMTGIVGALVLRAVFIAIGAAMLQELSVTYLVFGIVLTATAVQLFRHRGREPSFNDNLLVASARRRGVSPALLALLAIASTDLMFAMDSIPAVFGVTDDAYVVFVANAFALLGLRALFFLVAGLLARLIFLTTGLALILAFIGGKLVLHFAHLHHPQVPEVPTWFSLVVIAITLAATTVASLRKTSTRSGGSESLPGRAGVGCPGAGMSHRSTHAADSS
jgi:tellurite resistance protein TerC